MSSIILKEEPSSIKIENDDEKVGIGKKPSVLEFKTIIEKQFPKLDKNDFASAASSVLPGAQLLNFWKILHASFYNRGISLMDPKKPLSEKLKKFILALGEYYYDFLRNIRVADQIVSLSFDKKVQKMMVKFQDECLAKLSLAIIGGGEISNKVAELFLKLAFVWAELHSYLNYYNKENYADYPTNFMLNNSSATNLEFLHPYLSPALWHQLFAQVDLYQNPACNQLLVDLVMQKAKFLQIYSKEVNNVDDHLVNSTNWLISKIINNEQIACSKDLLKVLSTKMSDDHIVHLSSVYITKISKSKDQNHQFHFAEDVASTKLQIAVILGAIKEMLKIFSKMNVLKNLMNRMRKSIIKKTSIILQEVLNFEAGPQTELKNLLNELVQINNEVIENLPSLNSSKESHEECLKELIVPFLLFLNNLPINDYPKDLRSIIFLSIFPCVSLSILENDKNMTKLTVNILSQSGSEFRGNEYFFTIKWASYYEWLSTNENLNQITMRKLIFISLQNLYLSPKAVDEFESLLFKTCKTLNLEAASSAVILPTMEFIIQSNEAETKNKSKLKEKLCSHLNHFNKISRDSLSSFLSTEPNLKTVNSSTFSNIFYTSWLFQRSTELHKTNLQKTKPAKNLKEKHNLSPSLIAFSIDFLNYLLKNKLDSDADHALSIKYSLAFFHSLCKPNLCEKISKNFILDLWRAVSNMEIICTALFAEYNRDHNEIPSLLATDIFKFCSGEEFQEIASLIQHDFVTQSSGNKIDEMKVKLILRLCTEMLELEISDEKKNVRRNVFKEILSSSLIISLHLTNENSCLENMILPSLEFQTKLLRRRKALCGTNVLSLCLSSITSVPLSEIADIKMFRKVFCSVAELLNAFTIHRIDVLSFRLHIYLQCFEYVVESLAQKADQNNALSNENILDLRYCAHSFERICQSTQLGQKEFSRISPYLIAVLMRQFELFTVYPAVKEPLLSGCYKLLDLCDSHGISQLNSMFTIGSREIFKTVFSVYKKFYQYTGKV